MIDPFGRHISYLRVSVTDRCDFRCVYCMAEEMTFLPKADLLTLEELTARVGLTVRTVRFYTSRGLVPPPIRRGRSGYYSAAHLARIELVLELQSHGFTLSAIERYVAGIPEEIGRAHV